MTNEIQPPVHPEPSIEQAVKPRRPWLAPLIAGVVGLALGAGVAGAVAESTITKWSDKVAAVSSDRDQLVDTVTKVTKERDAAQANVETLMGREADLSKRAEELEAARVELMDFVGELEEREKAVGVAEEKAAANSIAEGVWLVGEDIKAGRYRTTETVDSGSCYWKIHKGSNIIDNDIVTGGRPTVTLRDGQEFTTRDCGTWVKR